MKCFMNVSNVKRCPDFESPDKKIKFWEEAPFWGVQKLSRNSTMVWGLTLLRDVKCFNDCKQTD